MLYNLITAAYIPYTGLNHNIWGGGVVVFLTKRYFFILFNIQVHE